MFKSDLFYLKIAELLLKASLLDRLQNVQVQVTFQLACGLGFLDGEVTPKLRGNNGSHSVNLNKEKKTNQRLPGLEEPSWMQ